MHRHLSAALQELRERLTRVVRRVASADLSPAQIDERVISGLLEMAAIRCFEVQVWQTPDVASICADPARAPARLAAAQQRLRHDVPGDFPPPLPPESVADPSLNKAIQQHLTTTLTTAAWQTPHLLGWFYQAISATPEQKQYGRFYTPEPVAAYIVRQGVDLLAGATSDGSPRVLDLACGAGVFALQAFAYFAAQPHCRASFAAHLEHILEHQLFFVDNDPRACWLARLNLFLSAKRLAPDVLVRRFNVCCTDALQRWETQPFCDVDAAAEFSAFFSRRYDLIIGNPPYLVIKQRQTPPQQFAQYRAYRSAAFKLNTFALFLERGVELLAPTGVLGMIVPNTLLTQVYYEPLRRYLLATTRIHALLDTKRMFDRAFVENCILLAQREEDAERRAQQMITCLVRETPRRRRQRRVPTPQAVERQHTIPQHSFAHTPLAMFHLQIDPPTAALLAKISGTHATLGELCECHDGVNPGNIKHKLIVTAPVDETCRKILNGKDICRYGLTWGGLYVRYNRRQALAKGEIVRWGHLPSLDRPKILTRQTADRIIGTYDDGAYYVTNSIHTTILRANVADLDLLYLLALLNSKLLSFYYRALIDEAGQVFAQVKLIHLRQLPIRLISRTAQRHFVETVEALLHTKRRLLATRSDTNERLGAQIAELETALDAAIFSLYQLTAAEIDLIHTEMDAPVK